MIDRPVPELLRQLIRLKNRLVNFRRVVWAQREMIRAFSTEDSALVHEDVRVFLRDVYDHCVQTSEVVESYREMTTGLMNTYLSSVGQRTNEVMKVLTIMSSIFIPLTFLAGIYGMNFEHMPELSWKGSYPALLLTMLATGIGMTWFFHKLGWLGRPTGSADLVWEQMTKPDDEEVTPRTVLDHDVVPQPSNKPLRKSACLLQPIDESDNLLTPLLHLLGRRLLVERHVARLPERPQNGVLRHALIQNGNLFLAGIPSCLPGRNLFLQRVTRRTLHSVLRVKPFLLEILQTGGGHLDLLLQRCLPVRQFLEHRLQVAFREADISSDRVDLLLEILATEITRFPCEFLLFELRVSRRLSNGAGTPLSCRNLQESSDDHLAEKVLRTHEHVASRRSNQ